MEVYRGFVSELFYSTVVEALTSPYSEDDGQPIVFNMLCEERMNPGKYISRIDEYKSWVDKFIWNEIEHPLNRMGLPPVNEKQP